MEEVLYLEIDVLLMNRPPVKVRVELLHLDVVEGVVVLPELLVDVLVLMVDLAVDPDVALPGQEVCLEGFVRLVDLGAVGADEELAHFVFAHLVPGKTPGSRKQFKTF